MDILPLISVNKKQFNQLFSPFKFSLYPKECISICGNNGVGKTSVLKWIAENYHYHLSTQSPLKLAFVCDRAIFYPHWLVGVFINWHADLYHCPTDYKNWIINVCGLHHKLSDKCTNLSHGYQQRLSLARALLMRPTILLLDEPMNGLDTQQRAIVKKLLQTLSKTITVVFSHHDYGDIADIANRIFYINDEKFTVVSINILKTPSLWIHWKNFKQQISCDNHYGNYSQHFLSSHNQRELIYKCSQYDDVISISSDIPSEVIATLLREQP